MQVYHGPDAVANAFRADLDRWATGEIRARLPDDASSESTEAISRGDGQLPLHEALHRWFQSTEGDSLSVSMSALAEISLFDEAGTALSSYSVEVYPAENHSFDIFFEDRSTLSALSVKGFDFETFLSEPITAVEYRTIERVIQLLRELDASMGMDTPEAFKLNAAIELLEAAHRSTDVGATRRYELWSVTKQVMRYIYKEFPVDVTKWSVAAGVIAKVWPVLGDFLRSL